MMHRLSRILLFAAAATAACQQEQAANRSSENAVASPPIVARPDPALDRAALLAAVAQAASASAAGTQLPDALRALDGRQFEVRVRFGCRGPSEPSGDEWLAWSFDPETRTVRVRARPTINRDDPLVAGMAGEELEAVEGFWIPRPWLLQALCPATAAISGPSELQEPGDAQRNGVAPAAEKGTDGAQPAEPLPAAQRVGIAQFFTSADPRTRRRDDRPYEAVHTLRADQPVGSQGFNLVLSGRLRAVPGRRVIECSAAGPDTPPDCIVSVQFQRVWIEQPETREVIAEWGSG
jgi:hypothetical protein